MTAIRLSFLVAALYGLVACGAQYLGPAPLDRLLFAGAAGATQLAYLLVAHDPRRYRMVIPVGIASKLSFAIPVGLAASRDPAAAALVPFAWIDVGLAAIFAGNFAVLWRRAKRSMS